MVLFSMTIHFFMILLSVAFFTLFERKIMATFHNRIGPNKISFLGILQPLLDAFKLLSKQKLTPFRANKISYNFSPHLALFLSLFLWIVLPSLYFFLSMNYSFIMFFCIGSLMVFTVLLAGWSSNSKYSLIGSLRSIAQSISYESVLSTLCIFMVIYISSFSISSFMNFSSFFLFFILPFWFICILAETHRAPFDFSEAESELVSGFNTEYSGAYFAYIFLSEYSILLFSCMMMSFMFFCVFKNIMFILFISLMISFLFIWVRITFCRFRYDMLMMFAWKMMLPCSLMISFLFITLIIF